jgi:hypothetical protein
VDPGTGYYLSQDGSALLMILRPTNSSYEISFNERLMESIQETELRVREAWAGGAEVEVSYTGSYVYALSFAQWLRRDFTLLSAIALGGTVALFFAFFGKLLVLPVILLPLAVCLLWTLSLAGLLLGYLNVVSIAFSSIVPGLGIDIAIHFYARFSEETGRYGIPRALEETFSHTGRATLTAVTTTAVVFFVFAFSSFKGIAELGLLCGLGMLISLAAMLIVFPCLLVAGTQWGLIRFPRQEEGRGAEVARTLQRLYLRHGKKLLLAALVAVIAMGWLARDVRFEQRIQGLVPKSFPPALVNDRIQGLFGRGGEKLIVLVRDRDLEGALQRNDALRRELDRLVADGAIRSFDSLSSFWPSERTQWRNLERLRGIDRERVLKDLREVLSQQGFRLEPFSSFFHHFMEAGQEVFSIDQDVPESLRGLMAKYLRRDGEEHLVATYLYCAGVPEFMGALGRLSSSEGEWRTGSILTAPLLVEKEFERIVRQDLEKLTLISILGVLAILALHFRGWREILVTVLPLFGSALAFVALMRVLDLPFNLFNLIVIPLMFGNGVDDHVYTLERYLGPGHTDVGKAVFRAGKAVVLTSLTNMMGFGALTASHFGGLVVLGITGMIGIGLNLFTSLTVMPALTVLLYRSSNLDTPR